MKVYTTLKSDGNGSLGKGKPQIQEVTGEILPATNDPWMRYADKIVRTHTGDIWYVKVLNGEIADYLAIH